MFDVVKGLPSLTFFSVPLQWLERDLDVRQAGKAPPYPHQDRAQQSLPVTLDVRHDAELKMFVPQQRGLDEGRVSRARRVLSIGQRANKEQPPGQY